MKPINGAASTKTLVSAAKVRAGRRLTLVIPSVVSIVAMAMAPSGPALATCLQSGNTVTCGGATNTGFGTGAENNLTLTVQPDGSITATNPVNLGTGNTAINNGAIVVLGGGIGIQGTGNNVFTNAGTMTLSSNPLAYMRPATTTSSATAEQSARQGRVSAPSSWQAGLVTPSRIPAPSP